MTIIITNETIIWLCLSILFYLAGYITHYVRYSGVSIDMGNNTYKGNLVKNTSINQKLIKIDDTKFVTDITTEGLEKKYTDLGETKNTTENVSSSVNKLKSMKG